MARMLLILLTCVLVIQVAVRSDWSGSGSPENVVQGETLEQPDLYSILAPMLSGGEQREVSSQDLVQSLLVARGYGATRVPPTGQEKPVGMDEVESVLNRLEVTFYREQLSVESLLGFERADLPLPLLFTTEGKLGLTLSLLVAVDSQENRLLVYNNNASIPQWYEADRFGSGEFDCIVLPDDSMVADGYLWVPGGFVDIGQIYADRREMREIILVNNGASDIPIHKVETTCGCVSVKEHPSVVPAGEVATMVVAVEPARSYGKRDFQQRIQLWTTDEDRMSQVVSVVGKVRSGFMLQPVRFAVGEVRPDTSEVDLKSSLYCSEADKIFVEPLVIDPGASFSTQTLVSEHHVEIHFKLDFSEIVVKPTGQFNLAIMLRVHYPSELGGILTEDIGVQFSGKRLRWIEAHPSEAAFGFVASDEKQSRKIRIRSLADSPPVVSVSDPDHVTAGVDGDSIRFTVNTQGMKPGFYRSNAVVQVAGKCRNVPVTAFVRSPEKAADQADQGE